MDPTHGLPGGLPDGLHILEPSFLSLSWLWVLLAVLIFLWWWRKRRRAVEKPEKPVVPTQLETPLAPVSEAGIFKVIDQLRQRHILEGSFRAGCHELATAVRGHLEDRAGEAAPETLTARELAERFQEPIGRLIVMIANLQWRRERPTRDDFAGVCRLAVDVLSATEGKRS